MITVPDGHDSNDQGELLLSPTPEIIISQLRNLVDSKNLNTDPNVVQICATALFARLKALNRSANAATRARKQATGDVRTEIDHAHLGLQNLQYEKRHLEREVEKCRQFASIYQDISLHPLENFLSLAPEGMRTEEISSNEHLLMLNRLMFEHSERQRLHKKCEELQQQKEELLKQSKANLTSMDSVKTQIDILSKAALEVQKKVKDTVKALPMSST